MGAKELATGPVERGVLSLPSQRFEPAKPVTCAYRTSDLSLPGQRFEPAGPALLSAGPVT